MTKNIRVGVYGIVSFGEKIVCIKKSRGPYTGLLDMPGGKVEYFEEHKKALLREIEEELNISSDDCIIGDFLGVEEEYIESFWDGENRTEHILALIYRVKITKSDFDLSYIESNGDAGGIELIEKGVEKSLLTPIFSRAIMY